MRSLLYEFLILRSLRYEHFEDFQIGNSYHRKCKKIENPVLILINYVKIIIDTHCKRLVLLYFLYNQLCQRIIKYCHHVVTHLYSTVITCVCVCVLPAVVLPSPCIDRFAGIRLSARCVSLPLSAYIFIISFALIDLVWLLLAFNKYHCAHSDLHLLCYQKIKTL